MKAPERHLEKPPEECRFMAFSRFAINNVKSSKETTLPMPEGNWR